MGNKDIRTTSTCTYVHEDKSDGDSDLDEYSQNDRNSISVPKSVGNHTVCPGSSLHVLCILFKKGYLKTS